MEESKFSVLNYANRIINDRPNSMQEAETSTQHSRESFRRWADEIRSILASPRGKTEEERQQYSDMLNRAVLGYEEDRFRILMIIQDELAKRRLHNIHPPDRTFGSLAEAVFAEVIGLNILELILKDRNGLEEIQVVGKDVFEVRGGMPSPSAHRLHSIKDLERIQQNLVLFNNDTFNPRKRWAEVMLRDGSRVTMTGFGYTAYPTLTIRFYTLRHYDLDMLCRPEFDTLTEDMKELLLCLINSYFNMVIIGPTNSGKTNFLKALIAEMPEHERIVTIESRYELMLKRDFPQRNIIEYETDDNDERHSGKQAFKLALRQSPKRICHAEIRDDDANIYVRACTRGHDGSLTSVHVSHLVDVPEAITDMCMLDGRGMNPERLTKRIAEFVTQIGLEMAIVNGTRKLVRIGEYEYSDGQVKVRDWVRYDFTDNLWTYPGDVSLRARERMKRYDPIRYQSLQSRELIKPC